MKIHRIDFSDDRLTSIDTTTGMISGIEILSETITCFDGSGRFIGQETVRSPWRFKQSWIDSLTHSPNKTDENSR